jgi:hypothetical protein
MNNPANYRFTNINPSDKYNRWRVEFEGSQIKVCYWGCYYYKRGDLGKLLRLKGKRVILKLKRQFKEHRKRNE